MSCTVTGTTIVVVVVFARLIHEYRAAIWALRFSSVGFGGGEIAAIRAIVLSGWFSSIGVVTTVGARAIGITIW